MTCYCDACKSWGWSVLPDSISPNIAESDRPIGIIVADICEEDTESLCIEMGCNEPFDNSTAPFCLAHGKEHSLERQCERAEAWGDK